MLPSTVDRVPLHTRQKINDRIQRETDRRISRYRSASRTTIKRRLKELDREWDIERMLETNAASVSLIGLALGAAVNRRLYVIPAIVAGFLLQHALQGWCPPLPVFRRMGYRTQSEIDREREALKAMLDHLP